MAVKFKDAPEVKRIVDELIKRCREFSHLRDANILCRFRIGQWSSRGKITLGQAKVLSAFERHETGAELAVLINKDVWDMMTNHQREALIYHELCHFEQMTDKEGSPKYDDNNRPMYKVIGHDLEEFVSVVKRYGLWMEDVKQLVKAADEHRQLSMFEEDNSENKPELVVVK